MGEALPRRDLRHDRAEAADDLRRHAWRPVVVEEVFSAEWARAVAIIARATGDLDHAEDAVQDAFATALRRWPVDGVPANPAAWILTTARNRAIDRIRSERAGGRAVVALRNLTEAMHDPADIADDPSIADERLALIFTCCHPALAVEAQVALTLRLVGGLEVGEIAAAFLTSEATTAQRLVRAKRKVRDAGIPIRLPPTAELTERLTAVLGVIYLIFNEGYSRPAERSPLAREAVRLAALLTALMPDEAEVHALRALLQLQHARRRARFAENGSLVLLEDQDRSLWDQDAIQEGLASLDRARALREIGPYFLQAAIAACHCTAATPAATDWTAVAHLYGLLEQINPSPVVSLNRAVAVSMAEGPEAALPLVEALAADLDGYYLLHATRADLLRRLERSREAAEAYRRSAELAPTDAERGFLARRLAEISDSDIEGP